MKKIVLIIFFFLFIAQLSAHNTPIERFKAGNEAYEKNDFETAISTYEDLLSAGYFSATLHYNLANAYFKHGNNTMAILHYEKALKIQPNFKDAAHNLEIANSRTIDKVEAIPHLFFYRWWKAIYNSFSITGWSTLLFTFLFLATIGFGIYFLGHQRKLRKNAFYGATTAVFLALICWGMADAQYKSLKAIDYAIIIKPTVNINSSPSEGSSKIFVLHQGTKVKIESRKDDWVNVSLPNGNKGWIKDEKVEGI